MWYSVVLVIGTYLWAAIPTAYLVSWHFSRIDIRDYGSGNVGAANVMTHVGKWPGLLLGIFDCVGKGVVPMMIAGLFEMGNLVQLCIGILAVAAHNWSPYLRFTGGRGAATTVGVVLGASMWQESIILVVVMGVLGRIVLRDTGLSTFISILLLPVLAFLFDRPQELVYMALGISVLLIAKRITANWEPISSEYSLVQVAKNRILWDRDVSGKTEWTNRRPKL